MEDERNVKRLTQWKLLATRPSGRSGLDGRMMYWQI